MFWNSTDRHHQDHQWTTPATAEASGQLRLLEELEQSRSRLIICASRWRPELNLLVTWTKIEEAALRRTPCSEISRSSRAGDRRQPRSAAASSSSVHPLEAGERQHHEGGGIDDADIDGPGRGGGDVDRVDGRRAGDQGSRSALHCRGCRSTAPGREIRKSRSRTAVMTIMTKGSDRHSAAGARAMPESTIG